MALNPKITDQGDKVKLEWTPDLTGQGYRLYVDGVAVSRTFKSDAKSTTFAKPDTASHRYGVQKMDVVDALEEVAWPAAPPPPAGALKWKPPGYPDYVGYTHINVTNANARPSLSTTTDYVVHITEKITVDGGVMLNGGRNIVVIGGEIEDTTVLTKAQAQANELWRQIGLYLPNVKGIAHIEGLHIHGVGCGDAIQTGSGAGGATIQIQNCRINPMHPVQNMAQTGWEGAHPDAFQCYAGPAIWRMYQDTVISGGTIRTWQPTEFGPNIQSVDIRRQNWKAQQLPGTYVIWDDSPLWPEHHEDIWLSYGGSGNFHRNGDITHAQFDPPNGNISGEAIKYGVRPEGDWVPASMVAQGAYVSPGYQ
jgi:hypothetical protein